MAMSEGMRNALREIGQLWLDDAARMRREASDASNRMATSNKLKRARADQLESDAQELIQWAARGWSRADAKRAGDQIAAEIASPAFAAALASVDELAELAAPATGRHIGGEARPTGRDRSGTGCPEHGDHCDA